MVSSLVVFIFCICLFVDVCWRCDRWLHEVILSAFVAASALSQLQCNVSIKINYEVDLMLRARKKSGVNRMCLQMNGSRNWFMRQLSQLFRHVEPHVVQSRHPFQSGRKWTDEKKIQKNTERKMINRNCLPCTNAIEQSNKHFQFWIDTISFSLVALELNFQLKMHSEKNRQRKYEILKLFFDFSFVSKFSVILLIVFLASREKRFFYLFSCKVACFLFHFRLFSFIYDFVIAFMQTFW